MSYEECDPSLTGQDDQIGSEQAADWRTVTLRVPAQSLAELLKTIGGFVAQHEVSLTIGETAMQLPVQIETSERDKQPEKPENDFRPEDFVDCNEVYTFAKAHSYSRVVAERMWGDLEDAFKKKLTYRKESQEELGVVPPSSSYMPIELIGGDGNIFFSHALADSFIPTAEWLEDHKGILTGKRREIFIKFVNERFEPDVPYEIPEKPRYDVESTPSSEEFELKTDTGYLSEVETATAGVLPVVTVHNIISFAKNELGFKFVTQITPIRKAFESMLAAALSSGDNDADNRVYQYFQYYQANELSLELRSSKGLLKTAGSVRPRDWQGIKELWGLTPTVFVDIYNKLVAEQITLAGFGPMTSHVMSRYINNLHEPYKRSR